MSGRNSCDIFPGAIHFGGTRVVMGRRITLQPEWWSMLFNLLGPLEVLDDEETVTVPGLHQRRALAFLLLHPNTPVSTNRLIDALWDGSF
jgi:hypothetical protein